MADGRILVFCHKGSDGARALVAGFKEAGVRCLRLRERAPLRGFRPGDVVLCWGSYYGWKVPAGVRLLNNVPPVSKLEELVLLAERGVMVPPFSGTPVAGWLPRSLKHQEGRDLLYGCPSPGFWTKKLPVRGEWRVHVVGGLSVRVGQKRPRPGFSNPHPWIRSYEGGWGLYYDAAAREGFSRKGRELAKAAVVALGLDAAAVDLWLLEDGRWVVGEVNRRVGIEGNTVRAYVEALLRVVNDGASGSESSTGKAEVQAL